MDTQKTCPDCGTAVDEPHINECDIELCSICKGQKITCDCEGHDPMASAWTGEWPEPEEVGPLELVEKLSAMVEQHADIVEKLVREDPEVRDAVETIHEFLLFVMPDATQTHDWRKVGF